MANRSYLYATDQIPSPDTTPRDGEVIGIAEWSYDIPLAFKLLLTGEPRLANSWIWQTPQIIAIVGDYDSGVARLLAEVEKITDPRITELHKEARQFLCDPRHQRKYFLLEPAEIFQLKDESPARQNRRLFAEICALCRTKSVNWPIKRSRATNRGGGLLFGNSEREGANELDVPAMGLGNWSEFLYYDFEYGRNHARNDGFTDAE